ncbi:MAG: hypothetical protein LBL49_06660 [Clostridiales Family XIII bacterium]|nr:hypothetical protein [Clostridiales Family XIII bacterium]
MLKKLTSFLVIAVLCLGIFTLVKVSDYSFSNTNDGSQSQLGMEDDQEQKSEARQKYEALLEGNYRNGELVDKFEEAFGNLSPQYIRENYKTLFDAEAGEIDEGFLSVITNEEMRSVQSAQAMNVINQAVLYSDSDSEAEEKSYEEIFGPIPEPEMPAYEEAEEPISYVVLENDDNGNSVSPTQTQSAQSGFTQSQDSASALSETDDRSVSVVIESNCDVNIKDNNGNTVLEDGDKLYIEDTAGLTRSVGTVWWINHETNRKQYIFSSGQYTIKLSSPEEVVGTAKIITMCKDADIVTSLEIYDSFNVVGEAVINIAPGSVTVSANTNAENSRKRQGSLIEPSKSLTLEELQAFNGNI